MGLCTDGIPNSVDNWSIKCSVNKTHGLRLRSNEVINKNKVSLC